MCVPDADGVDAVAYFYSAADGQAVVAGIEATEASVGPDTRAKYYGLAERIIRGGGVEDLALGVEPGHLGEDLVDRVVRGAAR